MKKIYIISNTSNDEYKIGFSKNPNQRLKTLQTANSDILSIVFERPVKFHSKIEKLVHDDFRGCRKNGEWFIIEDLDISIIDSNITKYQTMLESIQDNHFFK